MSPFKFGRLAGALTGAALMAGAVCGAKAETIDFMGWSAEENASHDVIFGMMDGFKAKTGVEVKWLGYAWSDMQKNLFLKIRANQVPDVVQLQARWLPTFARLPQIVDWNDVFGKDYLESQIAPGTLELGRVGDKQFGIPWVAGSVGPVANKKVMEAAGYTEFPQTIDGFVELLKAVKKAKPNSVPYTMVTKNNNGIILDFQIWLWTFGGELFDDANTVVVDSDASVKALQFMVDLIDRGLAAKDIDRPDSRRLFGQEESVFYFDAPLAKGFARKFSGQGEAYDANVLPVGTPVVKTGQPPRSVQWGHLLVAFKKDGKVPTKDGAAAKFIQHLTMTNETQHAYFQQVGLFPVSIEALNADQVKNDSYASAWAKYAQTAIRNELEGWPNTADMTTVIGEEVQSAMLGQKSAQDAVAAMQKRLEPLMAKNK